MATPYDVYAMINPIIHLRPATEKDIAFVAWVIITAVGIEHPSQQLIDDIAVLCRRDDVLYSWRNTIIAELDGIPVGGLTQYDGANYQKMRATTFPLIAQACGTDFSDMDLETAPGEYYLDSMAVLPNYRHRGIATALLKDGIERCRQLGIAQSSMIVSPENPEAEKLYTALGFRYARTINAFHELYRKMIRPTTV